MPLRSTSLQRLGSILLIVVIALLLGAILLVRSCSAPPPAPVKSGSAADSVVVRAEPDSSLLEKPRSKRSKSRKKSAQKQMELPAGSPLDHKM